MQNGDLAPSDRPRYVLVLEGVLCEVVPVMATKGVLRQKERVIGYHFNWHEIPLKRTVYLRDQFPEVGLDIVTFVDQSVADQAATFLETLRVPYDSVVFKPFEDFCWQVSFQPDLKAVYDSDSTRLDQYGQLGRGVIRGHDF